MKMNSIAVKNGSVLHANGELKYVDVLIKGGKIAATGQGLAAETVIDATGCHVLPGLIDLHTHGVGYVSTDEGTLEDYAKTEASRGATTFYPTFFGPPEVTVENLKRHLRETDSLKSTPQIAGFRIESPYLAKTGAGINKDLVPISAEITSKLLDAGGGHIKIWDISPELQSAPELVRELTGKGIVCSIAHTRCSIKQARCAVDAGARLVTHMFDTFEVPVMTDPGVYPAGLTDYLLVEDRLSCEIIGDGTHVHPLLVEKVFRCKSPERTVFVTDSNYGAGLPPGRYTLPGSWGNVAIDGPNDGVRMVDRDMGLAGSALTPIDNFRNVLELFGKDMTFAARVCSKTPAELMGLNKGEIAVGRDGDVIVVDSGFDVRVTVVGGKVAYHRNQ